MGILEDKVAIVTGGNSGIGRATARRFADEGAFVYVVARREAELAETAAEIGARASAIQADITKMDDLDAVYARIAADGRRLDVVVANAGRVNVLVANTPLKQEIAELSRAMALVDTHDVEREADELKPAALGFNWSNLLPNIERRAPKRSPMKAPMRGRIPSTLLLSIPAWGPFLTSTSH